jgi:DNA-binding NtrC family response regulator
MALGFSAHAAVDAALAAIATGGHLVLSGPPGCDHRQLARKIHERSARRHHLFVELGADSVSGPALAAALSEAALGTLFLDLHRPGRPLAIASLKELFSPDRHVRVIVAAPSIAHAMQRLGEASTRLTPIEIPAIKARRDDVLVLFDYLCAELPTERRLVELEPAWDAGSLATYDWPGNLDEMRQELPWLVALAEHAKVRATARALDMPHNTLAKWIKRIGLAPRGGRKRE